MTATDRLTLAQLQLGRALLNLTRARSLLRAGPKFGNGGSCVESAMTYAADAEKKISEAVGWIAADQTTAKR